MRLRESLRFGAIGIVFVLAIVLALRRPSQIVQAQGNRIATAGAIVDTPTITIAGVTVTSSATPTTFAREAHVFWAVGTVSGTYTTCTIQAKTSYDGTNFLTLGTAVNVTVTTGTKTAFDIYQQGGTTSVTTGSPSTSAALGFGQLTEYVFACSGAYGTSAPTTITAIYR